jgi:hypothetical protein
MSLLVKTQIGGGRHQVWETHITVNRSGSLSRRVIHMVTRVRASALECVEQAQPVAGFVARGAARVVALIVPAEDVATCHDDAV